MAEDEYRKISDEGLKKILDKHEERLDSGFKKHELSIIPVGLGR